jgi:hypothetical protein
VSAQLTRILTRTGPFRINQIVLRYFSIVADASNSRVLKAGSHRCAGQSFLACKAYGVGGHLTRQARYFNNASKASAGNIAAQKFLRA